MSTTRVIGVLLIVLALYLGMVAAKNKTGEWWKKVWG